MQGVYRFLNATLLVFLTSFLTMQISLAQDPLIEEADVELEEIVSEEISETEDLSSPIALDKTIQFIAYPKQKFGFDGFDVEAWRSEYPVFRNRVHQSIPIAYKSLKYGDSDTVWVVCKGFLKSQLTRLTFKVKSEKLPFKVINDTLIQLETPVNGADYEIITYWNNIAKAKLKVVVQKEIRERIILVPIVNGPIQLSAFRSSLNAISSQANIQYDITLEKQFKTKVFDSEALLSNPDSLGTKMNGQMRLLRDLYLDANPSMERNAYILFVVKGFQDSTVDSYMVKNKAVGFLTYVGNETVLAIHAARMLGVGSGSLKYVWENNGPEKGSTNNLMDTTLGTTLRYSQWIKLRKHPNYYSYYTNEENIATNNGMVGYYFWEEDKEGNIIFESGSPISGINRPYKKNYLSYRFKIKYGLLKPFYKIKNYFVSILDILFSLITILILWLIRKGLKYYWKLKNWHLPILRRITFIIILVFSIYQISQNYWLTNSILSYFKQVSGPLKELKDMDYDQAKGEILRHEELSHEEIYYECSEILINRNGNWELKKKDKVLYFDVKQDADSLWTKAKFKTSSNKLFLGNLGFSSSVNGHYMVFNYKDSQGKIIKQEVYDHFGERITDKIAEENPSKRILLFVNGYRPTSIGQTFEENFGDIQNNGLEYPNSKNYIYDFDRFDYWKPWNQINSRFQKRINPTETYYADGHFSVSTSNYRSLIHFTKVSAVYPKRCADSTKHTCYSIHDATWKQLLLNQTKTRKHLEMKPNKEGFDVRKNNGRVAGRNLLQILNAVPGYSQNDTLYVVAHSMGFAYAQGMLEVLKGKINFGGYYIIAPENGNSGKVETNLWQEIWQYGCNFDAKYPDAPCLQDGIAPQYQVRGLTDKHRVYIPRTFYERKGYYDSHFIGYYTWVLEIEKNRKGHITRK
jgi:hypothetical protein